MKEPRDGGMTLGALAEALGARLEPTHAATWTVYGVASLESAGNSSLVFAETGAVLAEALGSAAVAVLTTPELHTAQSGPLPVLLVSRPKLAFSKAAKLLRAPEPATGVHPLASVSPKAELPRAISVGPFAVVGDGARLGEDVRIDAGAVIGAECVLGPGCRIYPRAVLYPGVELGARVVVHAGAVLGSDGFGYVRDGQTGGYAQFPQQGRLVIEDDVEIGANTTVDRGALEETRIARGTKLDNLVHIAHNVAVGADVVIAAQTGVSGSSAIGAGAVVAGQVGIADHVTIGPGAVLGAQCGVPSHKRIDGPGVLFWGTPARPITQYLKELAVLARLARSGKKGRAGA